MGYVACNGKTYSKGDSSPPAESCKAYLQAVSNHNYNACQEDPVCKANHEFKVDLLVGGLGGGLLLCIALIVGAYLFCR